MPRIYKSSRGTSLASANDELVVSANNFYIHKEYIVFISEER